MKTMIYWSNYNWSHFKDLTIDTQQTGKHGFTITNDQKTKRSRLWKTSLKTSWDQDSSVENHNCATNNRYHRQFHFLFSSYSSLLGLVLSKLSWVVGLNIPPGTLQVISVTIFPTNLLSDAKHSAFSTNHLVIPTKEFSKHNAIFFVMIKACYCRHNQSSNINARYGCQAFAVAIPTTWNSFSDDLHDPTLSTDSFRRLLKTRLFSEY